MKAEVADLLAKAEAADQADVPDGMSIPEELARREDRLAKLAEARAKLAARAKERFEREQAEYQAKLAERAAKTEATGKKPGGRPPKPPVEGPLSTDQINLTDEESRIMPVAGGGFEQCYNAQAAVAADSMLVVATDVVQAANDKQQLAPMVEQLKALPEELGKTETLLADSGYFSAANVTACDAAGIAPLIATGREAHHPSLSERFAAAPAAPQNPTPLEAMMHRLKTPEGKQLYGLRKQVPPGSSPGAGSAGLRHHQVGAGLPAVPAARGGPRPRRVESCDHGVEFEADVRPLSLHVKGQRVCRVQLRRCVGRPRVI